jgi:hypothetical protein
VVAVAAAAVRRGQGKGCASTEATGAMRDVGSV